MQHRNLSVRDFIAIIAVAGLLGLTACSTDNTAGNATVITTLPPVPGAASPTALSSPGASHAPHPSPSTTTATPVTIAVVGDTMLGNTPNLPPDPAGYLDLVKQTLDSGAQIVFGNLEGTLTTATSSKCGPPTPGKDQDCFAFHDPPDYAQYLKDAGFTVLNDANNHSFDFGAAGQAQTVQSIHAAGLAQTGLPGEITVVTARGVKVAFVAFAPYDYDADLLDVPAAQALIEQAAKKADVVVVYMHAGAEGSDADHVTGHEEHYLGEDRGDPEGFAHMAIDAGASLVVASGPHVIRGMQFYRGHLIAYSVGNFAGFGNFGLDGDLDASVILHVTLSSRGRFESARIYPIQFVGEGQPVPGGNAVSLVSQLSSEDFSGTAARFTPSGTITPP